MPRPSIGVPDGDQQAGLTVAKNTAKSVQLTGHDGSASRHGLDQHDPEALTAEIGRAVDVRTAKRRRFLLVTDLPEQAEMLEVLARLFAEFLLVAASDHDHFEIRVTLDQLRQCAEEDGHPLARFVVATEEQNGSTFARVAGQQIGLGKRCDIDAVGNFDRVGSEGLDLPTTRQLRDCDPATDLLEIRSQDTLKSAQHQRLRGRRVEGGDDRAFRDTQREHGQTRRIGFVDM